MIKGRSDTRLKARWQPSAWRVFSCLVSLPFLLVSSFHLGLFVVVGFFFITQAQNPWAACQTTGICSRAPDSHSRSVHTSQAKKSITLLCVNTRRTWESTLSVSQRLLRGWWEDRQRHVNAWSSVIFRDKGVSSVLLSIYLVQFLREKKTLKISLPLHSRFASGWCRASLRQNKEGSCSFHFQQQWITPSSFQQTSVTLCRILASVTDVIRTNCTRGDIITWICQLQRFTNPLASLHIIICKRAHWKHFGDPKMQPQKRNKSNKRKICWLDLLHCRVNNVITDGGFKLVRVLSISATTQLFQNPFCCC